MLNMSCSCSIKISFKCDIGLSTSFMREEDIGFFQLYHGRNNLLFSEMRSALYQTNILCWILQCQLTETTVHGWTCRSTQTHYPDSQPISLFFFFLMRQISSKYQFYSLQLDPMRTRTQEALKISCIFKDYFQSKIPHIHNKQVNSWILFKKKIKIQSTM